MQYKTLNISIEDSHVAWTISNEDKNLLKIGVKNYSFELEDEGVILKNKGIRTKVLSKTKVLKLRSNPENYSFFSNNDLFNVINQLCITKPTFIKEDESDLTKIEQYILDNNILLSDFNSIHEYFNYLVEKNIEFNTTEPVFKNSCLNSEEYKTLINQEYQDITKYIENEAEKERFDFLFYDNFVMEKGYRYESNLKNNDGFISFAHLWCNKLQEIALEIKFLMTKNTKNINICINTDLKSKERFESFLTEMATKNGTLITFFSREDLEILLQKSTIKDLNNKPKLNLIKNAFVLDYKISEEEKFNNKLKHAVVSYKKITNIKESSISTKLINFSKVKKEQKDWGLLEYTKKIKPKTKKDIEELISLENVKITTEISFNEFFANKKSNVILREIENNNYNVSSKLLSIIKSTKLIPEKVLTVTSKVRLKNIVKMDCCMDISKYALDEDQKLVEYIHCHVIENPFNDDFNVLSSFKTKDIDDNNSYLFKNTKIIEKETGKKFRVKDMSKKCILIETMETFNQDDGETHLIKLPIHKNKFLIMNK